MSACCYLIRETIKSFSGRKAFDSKNFFERKLQKCYKPRNIPGRLYDAGILQQDAL